MLGSILVKAYERGEVKDNPEDLSKAFDLGGSLKTHVT
jgi:hypothetical protein